MLISVCKLLHKTTNHLGPGMTCAHPWTGRLDNGINGRSADGKVRDKEIYFAGVIDILQQYNIFKRTENFVKVCLSFYLFDINVHFTKDSEHLFYLILFF